MKAPTEGTKAMSEKKDSLESMDMDRTATEPNDSAEGHHRHLNAIGIKSTDSCVFASTDTGDERVDRFREERAEHSFDTRETWSLDYTLATWLYEHLMVYKDIAGKIVDLSFHQFDVPTMRVTKKGNIKRKTRHMSEGDAIELACEYLRNSLKAGWEEDDLRIEWERVALGIVAEILPALWW